VKLSRSTLISIIVAGIIVIGLILYSRNFSEPENYRAPETSDATFRADVLESSVPVLVDFWAPWCGPCRIAGPIIDRVGARVAGKAKVYKLNVDQNPKMASLYGIPGIPAAIVFRDGKAERTLIGVNGEGDYFRALGKVQ
jgi:thioredoxin 1